MWIFNFYLIQGTGREEKEAEQYWEKQRLSFSALLETSVHTGKKPDKVHAGFSLKAHTQSHWCDAAENQRETISWKNRESDRNYV